MVRCIFCLLLPPLLAGCALFQSSPVPQPPPPAPAVAMAELEDPGYLERYFERNDAGKIVRFRPLQEAQAAVSKAAESEAVAQHAPKTLEQAQAALQRAQTGWQAIAGTPMRNREALVQVRHQSHIALRKAQIALAEAGREVNLDTLADVHQRQQRRARQDRQWLGTQLVPGEMGAIRFAVGTARLTADSHVVLHELQEFLRDHPRYAFRIAGHTDNAPPSEANLRAFLESNPEIAERNPSAQARAAAYNLAMSQRRAQAVKQALVEFGADPERLSVKAYGQQRPLASNDTAAGRRKNRRVEVTVIAADKFAEAS